MPSTNAISQLKDDHQRVKRLFERFEELTPRAHKTMDEIRTKIVEELSVHAAIEERVFYPVVIQALPDMEEKILEGMQEHAVAEQLLAQVAHLDPGDRWFRPKVKVLIESVRHHIAEEEKEIFPEVRKRLTDRQLADLTEALEDARKTAPRTPPPSAQARGLLENVTDRAQELLHAFTGKSVPVP